MTDDGQKLNKLNIKILGPGCYNCYLVEQSARAALTTLTQQYPDLEATIQPVRSLDAIHKYAIRLTPGLVVNERLVCAGRIPSEGEVINWLVAAQRPPVEGDGAHAASM